MNGHATLENIMKNINYITDQIPAYALSYLVNGDASGLADGEQETIDAWFDECKANLLASHPGARIDFVTEDNDSPGFVAYPAFGLACDCIRGAVVAMVSNEDSTPPLALPWELDFTPAIHVSEITAQKYIGIIETGESVLSIVSISHPSGVYLVAGGACNTGLLPSFACVLEERFDDECLQEFIADIEEHERGGSPSGELLAWHGSLVI
jgi:hypothetical protein